MNAANIKFFPIRVPTDDVVLGKIRRYFKTTMMESARKRYTGSDDVVVSKMLADIKAWMASDF